MPITPFDILNNENEENFNFYESNSLCIFVMIYDYHKTTLSNLKMKPKNNINPFVYNLLVLFSRH